MTTNIPFIQMPSTPTSNAPPLSVVDDVEAWIAANARGWYDASNSAFRVDASGKCAQLTDRTGNGFHLLQATGANQPPVNSNYWGTLAGTNRDALQFDGTTDLRMETAGNLFDATTVWSFFMVCRPLSTTQGALWSTVNGAQNFSEFQLNGSTQIVFPGGGSGATTTVPTTQTKLVIIGTYNYPGSGNVAITHDINGVVGTASVALGSTAPGTGHLLLGSFNTTHNFKFNGLISELALFKSVLDSTTQTRLKAYAAQKYA